jgi:hypothetical protein
VSDVDIDLLARLGPDGSIELAGRPLELRALASILRSQEETSLSLSQPNESPQPYSEWLSSLAVRSEDQIRMLVVVEGGALVLAGQLAALQILAENLSAFAENPSVMGGHLHIEYFPDHFYLRPGSAPLTVVSRTQ